MKLPVHSRLETRTATSNTIQHPLFRFRILGLDTVSLKFERCQSANADALSLLAESVIATFNLNDKQVKKIRKAINQCRSKPRRKTGASLALDLGGSAPLTIVRQSALADALRALKSGNASHSKARVTSDKC